MKTTNAKTMSACALVLLTTNVGAEIQMAAQPYYDAQEIQFSIGTPPSAPALPLPPPPAVVPVEVWQVKRASYLHETMRQWAARAGWTLVWGLGEHEDLRFEAENKFYGDYKTVITKLFDSFPPSVRINAELRPDNSPPLIFINREDGAR